MKAYKVRHKHYYAIIEKEITRCNANTIWRMIGDTEVRLVRHTEDHAYFDTLSEAQEYANEKINAVLYDLKMLTLDTAKEVDKYRAIKKRNNEL